MKGSVIWVRWLVVRSGVASVGLTGEVCGALAGRVAVIRNDVIVRCPPLSSVMLRTRFHAASCRLSLYIGRRATTTQPGMSLLLPSRPVVPSRRLVSIQSARTNCRSSASLRFLLRAAAIIPLVFVEVSSSFTFLGVAKLM